MKIRYFLLLTFTMFITNVSKADTIHFITGEDEESAQKWFGKVLMISDDSVKVWFEHKNEGGEYSIHITKIKSIYFDEVYEHTYPIQLSPHIKSSIKGDLRRLRTIYIKQSVTKEIFLDKFPKTKIYGSPMYYFFDGNITEYYRNKGMIIDAETIDHPRITFNDERLIQLIRGWVR